MGLLCQQLLNIKHHHRKSPASFVCHGHLSGARATFAVAGNWVLVTFRSGISFTRGLIVLSLPSSYQLQGASGDVLNHGRAALGSAAAYSIEGSSLRIAVVEMWLGKGWAGWSIRLIIDIIYIIY